MFFGEIKLLGINPTPVIIKINELNVIRRIA